MKKQKRYADADEEEELELSLGLSMNGRFGVDPTAKKIKRTTSIPEFVNPVRDEEMGYVVPMACTPLIRTCSLPTETEEEWRKRKELQTLRRMEARRKRSEKQRNLKAMRERNRAFSEEVGSEGVVEGNNLVVELGAGAFNEFTSLDRTASLTTRVCGLGLNGEKEKEKGGGLLPPPSPSQGSIGSSQGTGSSGTSEPECQQGQGTTPVDARSPISANMLPEVELKSPVTSGARVAENSGKIAEGTMRNQTNKHSPPENRTKDIVRNLLEDMPCVSTKGEGPNGKRIQGFLYRYGKGEEVRIVCVCHGSFLTPAEFVKHAGGDDVANPLKHIVVSPSFL
ncbi:ninja-family protein AFP3 isoform X2 [Gastrolobium bilobum]|uniref:ninja-family protein AFP3 isoform X2 n=1 Tax=Gastrolobium bilobum TaxID=150636 RepID=UPI002AB1F86B|nr:ninja-family protein AFP3 isoform X2 [Gastrolobium bilobum]